MLMSHRIECFCAFCKNKRTVYRKKSIGPVAILGAFLCSMVMMILIFKEFDPRFMIFFVILLAISEIFVQLRWRLTIVCRHCNFDPVLYLKDTEKAVAKVREKLDSRKNDPDAIFARPLQLPTISKQKAELLEAAKKEQGKLLNKRI